MFEVVAQNKKLPSVKEFFQILTTFVIVTFAWIFFRSPTIGGAADYITQMVQDAVSNPGQFLKMPLGLKTMLLYIIPLLVIDWTIRRDTRDIKIFQYKVVLNVIIVITAYYLLQQIILKENSSFIYFQF